MDNNSLNDLGHRLILAGAVGLGVVAVGLVLIAVVFGLNIILNGRRR